MPWARKGFVVAEEQIQVKEAHRPLISTMIRQGGKLTCGKSRTARLVIQGNNFKVEFDESTGTIYSLTYDSTTIIAAGNGPKLDVLRAFTNNDNWFYSSWFDRGLHHLQHKAKETTIMNKPDGSIVLAFTVESQAPHAAKILGGTSSAKNTIEE